MSDFKSEINPEFLIQEYEEALRESDQPYSDENRFTKPEFFQEGGRKKLYKVHDLWAQRTVIKAIPKNDDPENVSAFVRESQLLSSLQHPNILPVYDVGTDEDGKPFMIMKLLEGQTLKEWIKRNFNSGKYLEIFSKICDAINFAHSEGVCHLDLKPENIRISPFGEVTVCDWGSASKIEELSSTQLSSTPGYIAPEALEGRLSIQCDIYSLGTIFYELLTRKPAFYGDSLQELLKANRTGKVNFDEIKEPSLKGICRQMLEKDPKKRTAAVVDIEENLQLFVDKRPVPCENAGVFRRLRLFFNRRPLVIGVAATFLGIITTFLIYFAFKINDQKKRAESLMNQYLEERGMRVSLSRENSELLFSQAQKAYDNYFHRESQELVDLSGSVGELTPEKLELKGLLSLVLFKPAEAVNHFTRAGVEEKYRSFLEVILPKEILVTKTPKDWCNLVLAVRKKNSYFYHHIAGSIFNMPELKLKDKEKFLSLLFKDREYPHGVQVVDNGRTLKFNKNAGNLPTYLFRSLRIKKLDFSDCQSFPPDTRMQELNHCTELEEMDFRRTKFNKWHLLKNNNVKVLHLPEIKISRVDLVQSMPLEELTVSGCQLKTLKTFLHMPSLKVLNIDSGMQKLPGFEELSERIKINIEKK